MIYIWKKLRYLFLVFIGISIMAGCYKSESDEKSRQDSPSHTEGKEVETDIPVITPELEQSAVPEAETQQKTEDERMPEQTQQPGIPSDEEQLYTAKKAEQVEQWISSMTIEQKAAQLFLVEYGLGIDYEHYPVSGYIYFRTDLESPQQTAELLSALSARSIEQTGIPVFHAVDEEGGTVTRIAGRDGFGVENPGNMSDLGAYHDPELITSTMQYLGENIKTLGFNVDFAPVADVRCADSSVDVVSRSFSEDPEMAADLVCAAIKGLHDSGVCSTVKHFPGLGDTSVDTHLDRAVTDKTLEEMLAWDLIPFQAAIAEGTEFIMVGHASAINIDPEELPSSISKTIITDLLRNRLGYDGIVITDAMNMGAVANYYSSGDAAVKAILAGADIILMPYDFYGAYAAVIDAVEQGIITEERVNESLRRILSVKYRFL